MDSDLAKRHQRTLLGRLADLDTQATAVPGWEGPKRLGSRVISVSWGPARGRVAA
jgi:hypothetical protein